MSVRPPDARKAPECGAGTAAVHGLVRAGLHARPDRPRRPTRLARAPRRRIGRARWAIVAASLLAACGDSGTGPPANNAPERLGSIPDQALKLDGGAATLDVSGNFSDPDGDALTYAARSSDDAVAAASVSGSVVTVAPVAPGTATISVSARDPGGLSSEPLSFAATVTIGPDLAVSVSRDSVVVAPGGSFRFSMTIWNGGDADAAATRLRAFESADAVITTSDDEIGEPADVPALAPGEFARGSVDVTVERSATAGTVLHLGGCADAVEGEFYTANNCSSALTIFVRAAGGDAALAATRSRAARPDSPAGRILRIDRSRFFVAGQTTNERL